MARHGLPAGEAHHALGDAVMTAELFLALATKLESAGHGTLGTFLKMSRRPHTSLVKQGRAVSTP